MTAISRYAQVQSEVTPFHKTTLTYQPEKEIICARTLFFWRGFVPLRVNFKFVGKALVRDVTGDGSAAQQI
jgi:hypothetical protein